jgi:phosphatidylglycerol:prolipoprotein diacylglycerol transferase
MESLVVLTNGPWYSLFYAISFWIALAILLIEGIKRRYPIIKWLVFLAFIRMLFIVGSKIIHFTQEDWMLLFSGGEPTDIHQQSFIGALMIGGLGIFAGRYLFRFKQNIADSFAFVLPVALAIMRIGCFGAGCCYGKVTNFPWAVKYPVNTLPHFHQFQDQLISFNDYTSLPVHPVQLYEIAGLTFVVFILLFLRKLLKSSGNLVLLSIALILFVRFITEFFRDSHAHTIGAETIWIFNLTQIVIFPAAVLILLLIRKRESDFKVIPSIISEEQFSNRLLIITLLLIFGFVRFKNWFVFSEIVFISLVLSFSIAILTFRMINQLFFSSYKWEYALSFILPLILMSQTLPVQKTDSTLTKKYKTIRIGFASGDYDNSYNIGKGEGCDRVSNTEYFKQKYFLAGAGLDFAYQQEKIQFNYGVNAILGNHQEIRVSDNYQTENTLFDVNPYLGLETNWIGAGGGLHAGNLAIIYENKVEDGVGIPQTGTNLVNIYPQLYFRVGPRRWFFIDYHLADNFPSALPGFRHQLGVGSGLGSRNGLNVRFGIVPENFLYTSGYFPIGEKLIVQPMVLWGESVLPDNYGHTNYQFSLGLGYRFGFKEEYEKKISP